MNSPAAPPPFAPPGDPVALARSLASRLGPERTDLDEKGYADAILAQLQSDRLLWPTDSSQGARHLSTLELARITAHVARLSGSAGLIYAMHMSQALSLIRHRGASVLLADLLDRLAAAQALVASGTSEKGVGGDIFGSRCTIEDAGDGALTVTKESPNISYMDHAAAVLVSAMREQASGRKIQVLVAVETSQLDLRPEPSAGLLGMRGILNRPYAFTARFREEAIFPEPYPVIARETMTPSVHILWAALWSGLAARVIDTVKAWQAKNLAKSDETASLLRAELSRLVEKQYALTALIRDAIADFEAVPADGNDHGIGLQRTARIKRLKTLGSELLEQISLGGLALIGLPAYAERGPFSLAEPLRDALSARVMVSNYRLLGANAQIERYLDEML